MKRDLRLRTPLAREKRLLVEKLDAELLVYDLDRHKAHCLNITAALIWGRCDGKTSIREMARSLEKESGTHTDEVIILYGIEQLEKAHLLVAAGLPAKRVSRRDLIRKVGSTAALPLVISLVAPRPVEAGSCVALGGTGCNTNKPCCSGVCAGGMCV